MTPPADHRLFLALDRASHRVRERLEQLCRARLGVSSAQLGALLHLARHDGARAGDVAAALGVQPAAVTGLADRMIAAGLVRRKPCPDDARVQRLHLTAAGRRAADGGRGWSPPPTPRSPPASAPTAGGGRPLPRRG
jgi:DNA-binding MarR family transcriptional regulator